MRALDWDNVVTVTAIADRTGTAYVHFQAPDSRQTTKCLPWWQLKPIAHPDSATVPANAADYFALAEQAISEDEADGHRHLAAHGIGAD